MTLPVTPSPTMTAMKRRAISFLIAALSLLGISIFLIAAGRISWLTILGTIVCGGYSGYLFYRIWRIMTGRL